MTVTDWIVAGLLLVIIGGVLRYLYRAKKQGETCIGCPHAKQCASRHCGGHGSGSRPAP